MRFPSAILVCAVALMPVGANAQIHVKTAIDRQGAAVSSAEDGATTIRYTESLRSVIAAPPGTAGEAADARKCDEITFRRWKPASQSSQHALCYWAQSGPAFVRSASLAGSSNTISNTVEIASDLQGPARLAFTTAVVGLTDENNGNEEEDAAERNLNLLRANGGNLALSAVYPLLLDQLGPLTLSSHGFARAAANVRALGGGAAADSVEWDELSSSLELSFEVRGVMSSNSDVFRFMLYARPGIIVGTDSFNAGLGLDDGSPLLGGELGVVARIGSLFTAGVSWVGYQKDLPGHGAALHLSFAP